MAEHLISQYLVGKALRKYDDWTIEILHTTKDRDEANRIEIEEIRHYNCVAPNGYNMTHGGDGGFEPCEETRKKRSDSLKGHFVSLDTREKIRKASLGNKYGEANKGKKFDNEHKRKISEAHKGKHHSKKSKVKIQIGSLRYRMAKLQKEIEAEGTF